MSRHKARGVFQGVKRCLWILCEVVEAKVVGGGGRGHKGLEFSQFSTVLQSRFLGTTNLN